MKILSWNVAGIRALLKKVDLNEVIKDYDIVCFQETKCEQQQFPSDVCENFPYKYWHSTKGRKGLHGTSIWSKQEPVSVEYGLPSGLDEEGRVITIDFLDFILVTVYTPNSKGDLSRLNERVNVWDKGFKAYVDALAKIKTTIICGDLNVAHKDLDIYNPEGHHKTAGFTNEERESFTKLLENYDDVYREFYPEKAKAFTFWPYTIKVARPNNLGWRLDYFLSSNLKILKDSNILETQYGSDHCPTELILNI